jgi:photosystem II stability/assembly factor-like uncharacterized protein
MRPSSKIWLVWATAAWLATSLQAQTSVDSNTFGGLEARAIGPATMSGRISALDAVAKDPLTIYVGAASGGVWKSTDGGLAFKPVFDEHSQSIGAITIDPTDPKTVWVGTGESWVRNSVSVGDGVYKTTDGGGTWKKMGLGGSERIARIRVDAKNPKTVFVCATGHLWNANEERGLYKTTDGGTTWKRVLYVDENTGCSDVDGDPQDSKILYAGMWQFRRSPDFFTSGGKGSGLYRSLDGGETWSLLSNGLPEGDKGRIAVAVAPSRPNVVYANVEAKDTALYRSDDLGNSWRKVNASFNVTIRPFYFSRLVVDPQDFNRIYKPGLVLTVSEDGGQSFTSPFGGGFGGGVHPDHHALWINPNNPHELLLGTDGGVYQSYDRASHWRFVRALPISQFYHVSYDMDVPYNVYGGLQDNGSWMGPSRSIGGIENKDWKNVGGGDGFYVYRDPKDANFVYSQYQGGNLSRIHIGTGEAREIKPHAGPGEPAYRFNWDAPVYLSPNEEGTLYIGAQVLLRSRDQGESWERISPDLTTNDPKKQRQKESGGLTIDNSTAENHTTIYTISESPKDGSLLWVGTDDGNLQLTRDGGKTWTNVVGNVPGLPKGTWVSYVLASPHDAATVFATFDGHRTGDMTTYVYVSRDFGASWKSLGVEGLEGWAHVVRQDLKDERILFLGTEQGLFLSLDGGAQWSRFSANLPKVAVHDIALHPREDDLILATHGRGIYIVDDISPLRQLSAQVLDAEFTLLPIRPTPMTITAQIQEFSGDDEFVGNNPAEAVVITYHLKKRHLFGDLKVEVYDESGKLLSTIPGSKRKGLNRVLWPMRLPPPKMPPATNLAPAFVGPRMLEGTYIVKLIKGSAAQTQRVQLVADPRSRHSAEDRLANQRLHQQLYDGLEDLTYLVETSIDLRDQARARAKEAKAGDKTARSLEDLARRFDEYRSGLVSTSEAGWLSGDEKLRENIAGVYAGLSFYEGRPTRTQADRAAHLLQELAAARTRFETLVTKDVATANLALSKQGGKPLTVQTREEWRAAQSKT